MSGLIRAWGAHTVRIHVSNSRHPTRRNHDHSHSMTDFPFRGVFTALVTPFRDGAIDETAFKALVERQIAAGVHGLVAVGTTGDRRR